MALNSRKPESSPTPLREAQSLENYTARIFLLKQNVIEEYPQQKLLLKEIS